MVAPQCSTWSPKMFHKAKKNYSDFVSTDFENVHRHIIVFCKLAPTAMHTLTRRMKNEKQISRSLPSLSSHHIAQDTKKKRQQSPLPHLIVVGLRHGEWRRRDKSPGCRTDRILEDECWRLLAGLTAGDLYVAALHHRLLLLPRLCQLIRLHR